MLNSNSIKYHSTNLDRAAGIVRHEFISLHDCLLYCTEHRHAQISRGLCLIASPVGLEHSMAYGTIVRWAQQLSLAGWIAIYFDYSGIGESTSMHDSHSFDRWRDDYEAMFHHFRGRFHSSLPFVLQGVRAGCLLADSLFRSGLGDALLLWEAPLSGESHLEEILKRKIIADAFDEKRSGRYELTELKTRLKTEAGLEVEGQIWKQAYWDSALNFQLSLGSADEQRPQLLLAQQSMQVTYDQERIKIPRPAFWLTSPWIVPDVQDLYLHSLRFLEALNPNPPIKG